MENLSIPKTKYTLATICDPETGILEMSGSSYPENAIDYFQPIIDWISTYISEVGEQFIFKLKLNYLNTVSTKCIFDIFDILEKYFNKGGEVQIKWYYEKEDEDILEMGKGIAEDTDLPFEFISY